MNFLRLFPVYISLLLLAAHFFRAGQTILAVIPLVLFVPLLLKEKWVPWLIQVALVLGVLEWIRTIVAVAEIRMEHGAPWVRMAVILGAVALFTALSCLVFKSEGLKRRYSTGETSEPG